MKTIRKSSSSRLINDSLNIKPGNSPGILGSLTLLIVKVSRDSDNSTLNRLSKMTLGSQLELGQDHGRNFLRSKLLLLSTPVYNNFRFSVSISFNDRERKLLGFLGCDRISERTSNDTLDIVDSVGRVGSHLSFGCHTYQLSFRCERDPRRHSSARG
mmetsp:Transcript_7463/g.11100  ORF Transcript_7463/g.11100 Transcript_7463/m.11100 type:complete len:157 (-) Transcript_7463:76-546(-)